VSQRLRIIANQAQMHRIAFTFLLCTLCELSLGCSVMHVSDPAETPFMRQKQEHAHWITQVAESSVVAEVVVADEVRNPDHALYSLRPARVWKSDGDQLTRAYVAFQLCSRLELTVGQRYVVFAVRRDIPATHRGRPLQVKAIESLTETPPQGADRDPTLASTHTDRLLKALSEATAVRARIVP
jgi:hypothetical protein